MQKWLHWLRSLQKLARTCFWPWENIFLQWSGSYENYDYYFLSISKISCHEIKVQIEISFRHGICITFFLWLFFRRLNTSTEIQTLSHMLVAKLIFRCWWNKSCEVYKTAKFAFVFMFSFFSSSFSVQVEILLHLIPLLIVDTK